MHTLYNTERLTLRKVTENDAPFILQLVNTPAWHRFIGDRNVHSESDAESYLRNGALKQYEAYGFGSFCMELTESKTPIGMCGLYKRDYFTYFDLGFALLPEFEGRGLAFEAAQTIVYLAKNDWKLPALLAITSKDNDRSMGLLQRLGFQQVEDVQFPNETEILNCFRLELHPESN